MSSDEMDLGPTPILKSEILNSKHEMGFEFRASNFGFNAGVATFRGSAVASALRSPD